MSKRVTFNRNPLLSSVLPQWRSRFVLLLLLVGFVALVARSLFLQGVNNEFLQAKGESRYARVIDMPATRGRVVDRNGDVLAVSTPVKSIWAIPEDVDLKPAQARKLAELLDMDVRDLTRKLATEKDFVYLKRQIAPDVAQRVAAMSLPGIHEQKEYRRYYPGGDVMAHMLGFT
ncbi:MAG: penicillin-binding protein 2, partial [Rhodocyclaceae bacterium]